MPGSTTTTRTILQDIPLRNNLRASSGIVTFTRASTAWYEDDAGVVQTALTNIPRISPTKGLLIEEARKNELIWTNVLDQVAWSHQGIGNGTDPTITADQAIAPDGTMTADKIDFGPCGTGDSNSILFRSTAPAGLFVESVYLRTVTGTGSVWLGHSPDGVAAWQSVECACDTTWRRFTLPVSSVSGSRYFILGQDGRDAAQPATFPAVSVYAWNAQSEVGSFATSPITASAAQVTRTLEVPLCNSAGWGVKEGSISFKYRPVASNSTVAAGQVYSLMDSRNGAQNEGLLIYFNGYNTGVLTFYFVNVTGATGVPTAALTWTAGVEYSIKVVWNRGNVFAYRDGVLVASNTTGAVKIPNSHVAGASIGATPGFTASCNGWIKDFVVSRF